LSITTTRPGGSVGPAHAFLHENHRQQLAVATVGLLTARFEISGQCIPEIIDQDERQQAEVGEIGYDHGVLRLGEGEFQQPNPCPTAGRSSTSTRTRPY